MFTKFLSLLTIATRGLKINPCAARCTEKVGQHWCRQSEVSWQKAKIRLCLINNNNSNNKNDNDNDNNNNNNNNNNDNNNNNNNNLKWANNRAILWALCSFAFHFSQHSAH